MSDNELIKKAKKALKVIGITYDNNEFEPYVNRLENELLLEMNPNMSNEFTIHFPSRLPDGRKGGYTITVEKETNKLLLLITRSNTYEIPEELS